MFHVCVQDQTDGSGKRKLDNGEEGRWKLIEDPPPKKKAPSSLEEAGRGEGGHKKKKEKEQPPDSGAKKKVSFWTGPVVTSALRGSAGLSPVLLVLLSAGHSPVFQHV